MLRKLIQSTLRAGVAGSTSLMQETDKMTGNLNWKWATLLCLLVGVAFSPGCVEQDSGSTPANATGADDHGHDHEEGDHAHDHDHEGHDHEGHDHDHDAEKMGEHGGHIAHFDGDKGAFEWTHNDSANKVTIYLLGEDEKSLNPVAAQKCVMVLTSGEKTKEFELAAIDEADGKAATFQLEDPSLIAALQMGVQLKVATDGGELNAEIKPHVH